MIKKILDLIFGWESIFITADLGKYSAIKGKLTNNGIKSKTKIDSNSLRGRGHSGLISGHKNYEILVRKEDMHAANEIINNR